MEYQHQRMLGVRYIKISVIKGHIADFMVCCFHKWCAFSEAFIIFPYRQHYSFSFGHNAFSFIVVGFHDPACPAPVITDISPEISFQVEVVLHQYITAATS